MDKYGKSDMTTGLKRVNTRMKCCVSLPVESFRSSSALMVGVVRCGQKCAKYTCTSLHQNEKLNHWKSVKTNIMYKRYNFRRQIKRRPYWLKCVVINHTELILLRSLTPVHLQSYSSLPATACYTVLPSIVMCSKAVQKMNEWIWKIQEWSTGRG